MQAEIELHIADRLVDLGGELGDTAVAVAAGRVLDTGPAAALRARHPGAREQVHAQAWLVPGLRNAHGHVGGWPPDARLEVYLIGRYAAGDEEAMRAATLATGLRLVRAGVTWTHHLHYGPGAAVAARAYRETGLRVQLCLGVLDRFSVIPYDDGDVRLHELLGPEAVARLAGRPLGKRAAPVDEQLERFRALRDELADDDGIEVILGPDNPQWCTDACLTALAQEGGPLHLHVQENASQYARAVAATGMTPVARLAALGLLGPDTTLAHLTHATAEDLALVAASGAHAALNVSSNLRLGAGIPPIGAIHAAGIPWGLGVDGAGLLDDQDLWHEARLAMLLSRGAAGDGGAPAVTAQDALAAASGSLAPGEPADFVVLDAPPEDDGPAAAALLRRVDARSVRHVYVGGVRVVEDGRARTGALPPPVPARSADPEARALVEAAIAAELGADRGPRRVVHG